MVMYDPDMNMLVIHVNTSICVVMFFISYRFVLEYFNQRKYIKHIQIKCLSDII